MNLTINQSEEKFRKLFETMDQGVIYQDGDGAIIDANPAAARILGLSRDQLLSRTARDPRWQCIGENGSDLPGDQHPSMIAIRTGQPVLKSVIGVYHPGLDGHCWIMVSAIPEQSEDGTTTSVTTTFTDITDRKRAEEATAMAQLQQLESEHRYRSIIDNMQDAFYRADASGLLTMVSPSGVRLLGYNSADEMIGCVIRDTFYADSAERDAFIHNLKLKGYLDGYEVTLKRKDGTPVPVATSTHLLYGPDGSFAGVEGVFRDISIQRAAENALRNSEEKFSKVFSQAPLFMTICDIDTGKYLEVNNRFCEISGFSQSELIGRTSLEVGWISLEERERLIGAFGKEEVFKNLELRHTAKDGRQVIILHSGAIINYGGCDRILSIGLDITDRMHTEQLLKESEERYRQLVEQSSAWIWKTDAKLRHIYSNENVEKILGYSIEELYAMDIHNLVHPDDQQMLRKVVDEAVSSSQSWSGLVLRWLAKDGTWRYIESSGVALLDVNGSFSGLQGIDTDVTDRLDLQHEREKRQRLESLGLLAGGIAHDFNNILTGIVGNLSLARMMIDSEHRASTRLEECEKAAKRASELTQQLLTFARGGEPVKKSVDTSRLINEAVSFCLRGSNIKAEIELDFGLWNIDADEGQVNQALNNLLINATQAMPDGGVVKVRAENIFTEDAATPAGRFVRIIIKDSGVGIPPDILSKVFDPYFTTKTGGSGLGLASVYSIVKRHGGRVDVASEVGHGTEFEIYLPAAAGKEADRHEAATVNQVGEDSIGRILVMDDEEMIIEVVSMMLTELGGIVDTCCDGAEAVEMYRNAFERGTPYDAVILDLTIPGGMGGLEAARQIRALNPKAALIVSSGYSQDAVISDYHEHGFCGAVMKPYAIETLIDELKAAKTCANIRQA